MEITITEIKRAITEWEKQKQTPIALQYLTSGFGFEFLKSDYDAWNKASKSNNYYVYLGIHSNKMLFFISSQLKENITQKDQVITSEFYRSTKSSEALPPFLNGLHFLDPTTAMKRVTNWLLCCNYWYSDYIDKELGLVSYFIAPKTDIDNIFTKDNAFRVICLLALKFEDVTLPEGGTITNYIELIFIGETKAGVTGNNASKPKFTAYKDITRPKPPFSD